MGSASGLLCRVSWEAGLAAHHIEALLWHSWPGPEARFEPSLSLIPGRVCVCA